MKSKILKSLLAFLCAGIFCTSVFAKANDTKVSVEKLSVENYKKLPKNNARWYTWIGSNWAIHVRR